VADERLAEGSNLQRGHNELFQDLTVAPRTVLKDNIKIVRQKLNLIVV
jgi:hypothetical protein